ncbi:MAG: hypothetical protein LKM39_08160 [Chiayiivirga sp.]|jgi:hypothetical protein|nr:hypothetical protein [Chiayiivirga sp.]
MTRETCGSGTHGGLSQLRETRFATYSIRDGLADDFVRSMVEDAAGSVWIASNGGVSRIRAGRIESVATQFPRRGALDPVDAGPRATASSGSAPIAMGHDAWMPPACIR